jgi:tetratricopeptide (TPR) repeat protein
MINNTTSQQNAAMHQNNSAVALISAGHYDAAMSSLSSALKTYKQLMDTNDASPQTEMASLDRCMAQSSAAVQGNHLATHEDKSGRYIYRQAIRIPQDMQCDCQTNAMLCVVVIFNLALAHHLAAGGETKQHRLRKAVKLYELAFQLLQQEEHLLENNVMFTMATLNNIGLAHQQLNDEETASKCFQHLLSALMLLVDCGQVNVRGELDGFLRNVSGVICTYVTAPAA